MATSLRHSKTKPESRYGRPHLRFWDRVDKNGPTHPIHGQCWTWTGCIHNATGYGIFSLRDGQLKAHRYSWELHVGPVPLALCVLHKCDNRSCVNPGHLFLGSPLDNVMDMVSKGRQAKGDTHKSRTKPETIHRGSAHCRAKLTEEDVLKIRATYRYKDSRLGSTGLARAYGVSQFLIMCILKRKIWKHI